MDVLLAKIFAIGLALSQVTTTPDSVRTEFDANQDQAVGRAVVARRAAPTFSKSSIFKALISMTCSPPRWTIRRRSARTRRFAASILPICRPPTGSFARTRTSSAAAVDLADVIAFYNKAAREPAGPQQAQGPQASRRQRRARPQGRAASPRFSRRTSAACGWSSPTFRSTCGTLSWRRKTSASTSTRASTSTA